MNTNNNIPQNFSNMQKFSNRPNRRPNFNNNNNNGDRLIGGGFFGPFILGGITGGLIANSRPNYPMYYPYPYPYYQTYPYYSYRPY